MESLFSFFNILLVAVLFSQLFSRMKIPWVVSLLVGGIVIGPSGFNIYEADPTIEFFALIGLIFLMFMAGLESNLSGSKGLKSKLAVTGVLIGLVPAVVGAGVVLFFGYSLPTAVLIGIVFMSSSVALLIPQFQEQKIFNSELGRVVVLTAMGIDAVSLVLLSVFLQWTGSGLSASSILVYVGFAILLFILAKLIPKLRFMVFEEDYPEQQDLYEKELRFLILVLIAFVLMFELVGLHAIVAAFFAGLTMAGSVKSRLLRAKLHAVGYGFLIPIFFVTIGASVDMSVLVQGSNALMVVTGVIAGLLISKFIGGWIAGRLIGFDSQASSFLGVAAIPQLSTALAVTFLGFGAGLLDEVLLASIVTLSVITAILAPIITSMIGKKLHSHKVIINTNRSKKETV